VGAARVASPRSAATVAETQRCCGRATGLANTQRTFARSISRDGGCRLSLREPMVRCGQTELAVGGLLPERDALAFEMGCANPSRATDQDGRGGPEGHPGRSGQQFPHRDRCSHYEQRLCEIQNRVPPNDRGMLCLPQGLRKTFSPSPSAERGQRVGSQFRSQRHLATMKLLESVSRPLHVTSIVVFAAVSLAEAEDDPPPTEPAESNTTVHVSNVQPGIVNDLLRNQSSSFNAWDFGGQFRARYEHPEYLGPVDFSATGGHSSDNRMLLRTFVHVGYDPRPWLNFYAEGRDSRGFWDEPNPNPDLDTMDLHQAFVRIGNPQLFPFIAKIGRQELSYGDERLIGISDWTNVRRTFDAAKLRYEVEGFWIDAFVSHPVIVWNDHFNESDDQDWFSGVYASTTKLIPWQESEVYFISRNAGSGSPGFYGPSPDPQGATPRDIYTIGVHFKSLPGKLGGWDYNLEAAGQFGRFKEA